VLDFRLHPLPSAAVSAALPRGHATLAFVDVGVGFVDRAAVVVAVGFSQDLWVLHSICINPETLSTFDPPVNEHAPNFWHMYFVQLLFTFAKKQAKSVPENKSCHNRQGTKL
jgi:hypothetical protein